MTSSIFDDLITQSKNQSEPQRLLFLFAQTEAIDQKVKVDHKSGTISPLMCVDKLPNELTTFSDFTEEADRISKKWDLIFVSSMSGKFGQIPTSKDADAPLMKMSNDLAMGRNMSQYVIIDRNQKPIVVS